MSANVLGVLLEEFCDVEARDRPASIRTPSGERRAPAQLTQLTWPAPTGLATFAPQRVDAGASPHGHLCAPELPSCRQSPVLEANEAAHEPLIVRNEDVDAVV